MPSDPDKHAQHTRHKKWMDPAAQPGLASIIIPTFNRAELLSEAIASAVAQTHRPLEIIVIDDGSTDHTPDVIKQYQDKLKQHQLKTDSGITLQYHPQPNSGVASARNRGLIESRGEFLQFLDSDDFLHPQKLSLQIAALQRHPECGYLFSGRMFAANPHQWPEIPSADEKVIDSAKFYCRKEVWIVMPGLYRRATCREIGPFSEDMTLGEDEEYNLRVLLATPKLVHLPGTFCAARNHSGPRLTDGLKGRTGLIHSTRMYRRMIESADAAGRLNNAPLVSALTKCLTDNIIEALETGSSDVAHDAIKLCQMLPIELTRRLRLAIFQALGSLPPGTFPHLWHAWLKLRHTVLEIPNREISRLRNTWKSEKRSA